MKRTMKRRVFASPILLIVTLSTAMGQAPTPTPQDKRGIGVQSETSVTGSKTQQQAREAKPELVLQTGYNNFYGATRLLFSPDERLLATATFRSNSIKLWETATGRELRNLSSAGQSAMSISPFIAFSPDGRLIAASTGNNSVKIWEVSTGREHQTLVGSQGSLFSSMGVYFIGFASSGRIVTISDAIRIWDVASGQTVRTIEEQTLSHSSLTGGGSGAAISPNGNHLALVFSQGLKTQVRFWDLSSGREERPANLMDEDFDSTELTYTPDGRILVAAILEKRLKLWELGAKDYSKIKAAELGTTTKEQGSLRFSRDGRRLSLIEGYTVKTWDTDSGRELPVLTLPNSGLFGAKGQAFVTLSNDGTRLASGGFDTPTTLWDASTGKQLLTMTGRTNMAYRVAFSSDGTYLLSGGRTRWDLRAGRGLRISEKPTSNLFVVPSPDGRLLSGFAPNNGSVTVLEAPSGRQLHTLTPSKRGIVVQDLSFSSDGTKLLVTYAPSEDQFQSPGAAGGISGEVRIWDVKSGRELRTLTLTDIPSEASFSADGRVVAVLGSMNSLSLWDANSGAKLRYLTASQFPNPGNAGNIGAPGSMPSMPNVADLSAMITNSMGALSAGTMGRTVTSVTFSNDGRIVATGGVETKSNFDLAAMMSVAMGQTKSSKKQPAPEDMIKNFKVEPIGQVVFRDVSSGRDLGVLKGHGKGVSQVAFSHDSKLLASGSTDNSIRIWDVAARRELATLGGHTANIESIAFSPDSKLLASTSEDGATFLWDTSTGEHLLTLISLDDGGEWMVVTPQGLFDGTPASWNQILWRYDQDTFNVAPIEVYFNEYYHPGLLADIFAGKRPRVSQDVSKKDRRQPAVKLSLVGVPDGSISSRTVKVRIEVADAPADKDYSHGTGAHDLRLFRNGLLVKAWRGDVLKGQVTVTLEEEITVAAGANYLTAYAFNRDNVKSKDAQLQLMGADSLKRPGTAYIVAVGVNEYANPQYNLKYAVADAQGIGEELRQKLSQLGRFEKVEVVTLLNERATKANLLSALKRLAGESESRTDQSELPGFDSLKQAEPEDTVIIYFAGHGTAQSQRFYLIPHDLGYMGERTRLDPRGLQAILSHSVSDMEIEQAVEGIDASHMLLIIDACNSGQALEAEEKRRGPMNSKGLAQLAYEKGMYILTAAQSYQAALEAAQLGHGLLTYALVAEGLKTPAADREPKDGAISAKEWLDFATERVPQIQEDKMKQARGVGVEVIFAEGEQNIADPQKRSLQRPRVFYRRELEAIPLVIARS